MHILSLWLRRINGHYTVSLLLTKANPTPARPQAHRGKQTGYERALARKTPVNPSEDRAGLVIAYADVVDSGKPQLYFTLTPKPLGYHKTPVFAPVLMSGQAELDFDPERLHGWPVYMSKRQACKLGDAVIREITRIQGYSPDYIRFNERQRNGNYHIHGAMSNVNLQLLEFGPAVERPDKRGRIQLAFRGLEKIAWGIMGRANFQFWGGLDGFQSASHYFTKDMFRWDKDGVDVEVSPLWGKRKRKQPQFTLADNSLWTDRTEAGR